MKFELLKEEHTVMYIKLFFQAQQLAKIMEKSCLEDEEKRECYMSACSGCHESSATLSVVLTQRYLQTCPDTIEEFCGHSEQASGLQRRLVLDFTCRLLPLEEKW